MKTHPVKACVIRSKRVPEFFLFDDVYYEVNQTPINSGRFPKNRFDLILVNTRTRLAYTACVMEYRQLIAFLDSAPAALLDVNGRTDTKNRKTYEISRKKTNRKTQKTSTFGKV